jgi:hypothetical protein
MATASTRLDKESVDTATVVKIMKDNPDLTFEFVKQSVISQAERDAGKLETYEFI